MRVAAFDLGTNSTRLLLADAVRDKGGSPRVLTVERRMTITRLGEGVDLTGSLSEAAIARTQAALEEFQSIVRQQGGADRVRVAGTSALRDAGNAADLEEAVREVLGVKTEVIPGKLEAWLSFVGATYDIEREVGPTDTILVVDIGGGSTEIILGSRSAIREDFSVNVGCVRMSERFLASDPPVATELRAMEDYVEESLQEAVLRIGNTGFNQLVGLAGTVTTLSGINLGLEEYSGPAIHHSRLGRAKVESLYAEMAAMSSAQRARFMRLEPGRSDVILGGTAILLALLRGLDAGELLVSEKDILDGLVISSLP